MSFNPNKQQTEANTRLLLGWTTTICGLLVLLFYPLAGTVMVLVGACVFAPTYVSNRRKNEEDPITRLRNRSQSLQKIDLAARKEQAFDYRDLFQEGIITSSEYHNAIACLYPELDRERQEPIPVPTQVIEAASKNQSAIGLTPETSTAGKTLLTP